jgi:putative solute:sodium symporter small subunit
MPRIAPARTAVTVVHWRRTRRHAASVLGIWLLISLAIHTVAAELNSIQFLSFPLGYYLAAQGSLIGLLALIGWFVWRQNRIDIDLARS